jgi:2,4-dienoyl-CoA reductase-like NADH-dependent reductase (Old Yellow Enzyme family)
MNLMPQLLDPLKIGTLELRNRIVMPPMATNYADKQGKVTDKLIKHYTDKTKDLGLLIVEHSFVTQRGRTSLTQLGANSDVLIPGLKRVADAVHRNETPLTLQINHGGGSASSEITGSQPVSPSPIMHPRRGKVIPHQLTLYEIEEIINNFRDAANRAATAGFDAVEVHGAHGFLLSQFLSPLTNRRHDEYGGNIENRVRLPCRIIEEIKRELGSNFPILYRIGVDDLLPGGITTKEGVEAAKMIAKKGINIMDVSGGIGGIGGSGLKGPGYFVPYAAAVKKVVDIPVIGVGGIQTAEEADEIIRSGKVDLVAVGRAILKDSEWASKAVEYLSNR